MNLDELESKIIRLMSFPLKSQIKIDFDVGKKSFILTATIYRSGREVPPSVQKYVKVREGMVFKPHKTSFRLENDTVQIVQELPFECHFQEHLRQQTLEFWKVAKHCYQMLSEIASET